MRPPGARFLHAWASFLTTAPERGDQGCAARRRPPGWVELLLVSLACLAVILSALDPSPHDGGDNAGYLSLAHSLASDFRYVEAWDPEEPPHTKYPPLYPALLAATMLLGAETWIAFKVLSALFVALAVVLSYVWVRDRHGTRFAVGIAMVLVFSPAFLWSSQWILSDPLFLALTLGCLWAFDRSTGGDRSGAWIAAGCAMAILATFTRTAGLPLVLAAGGALALQRRWRAVRSFALAFAIPSVAWWLRARSAGQAQYISEFWLVNPYQPHLGTAGTEDLVRRALANLQGYVFSHIPGGLTDWPPAPLMLLGLLLVGLAAVGWVRRIREGATVPELFLPLYFGLILLWPEVWSGDRFALPLYPLLLLYAGEALLASVGRMHARAPLVLGLIAASLLIVPSARSWNDARRRAAACREATTAFGPFACHRQGVQEFAAAAWWLGENALDGANVFSRKPRMFYALSGGVGGRTFPLSSDPNDFFEEGRRAGVSYLVFDRLDRLGSMYVAPVLRARPEAFCGLIRVGTGDAPTRVFGLLTGVESDMLGRTERDTGASVGSTPCPDGMLRNEPRALPAYTTARLPLLSPPSP